jgi:hypothetical protein
MTFESAGLIASRWVWRADGRMVVQVAASSSERCNPSSPSA